MSGDTGERPSQQAVLADGAASAKGDGTSDTLFGDGGAFGDSSPRLWSHLIGAILGHHAGIIGGIRYAVSGGDQSAVTGANQHHPLYRDRR